MLTVDVLRKRGIKLSDEEFAALLDDALDGSHVASDDPIGTLTPAEVTGLTGGGADISARQAPEPVPRGEAAAAYGALLAGALTVAEAAARLDIDASRVRHRLGDGSLYGVRLRSGWRLPAFQFADPGGSGVVPGLDRVLPVLPGDLHPVAVWRWFATPVTDLRVEGAAVSPLAWLAGGGDPGPVAALAADL